MPSPHNHVAVISRGKNQSAVAAAAYRHAAQMSFSGGTVTKDYRFKLSELVHAEIALPSTAPARAIHRFGSDAFQQTYDDLRYESHLRGDGVSATELERATWSRLSEQLWQSVEAGEDRLNKFRNRARVARSVTLALPSLLKRECQIELVQGYVKEAFTSQGMVADWVIHDTGNGNPHAHIMLTLRRLTETSWNRHVAREWNDVSVRREQRETWTQHANAMLEREGFDERIDHRTLAAQQQELGAVPKIKPEYWSLHHTPRAVAKGDFKRDRERYEETRRTNQQTLRDDPEHMLIMVQIERATFGRQHVEAAFAKRLDLSVEHDTDALRDLTDRAMSSTSLLPVIGKDGPEQIYITAGKARLIQQLATDAARLQGSQLEDTWTAHETIIRLGDGRTVDLSHANPTDVTMVDQDATSSVSGETDSTVPQSDVPVSDALDRGRGPVHMDVAAFTQGDKAQNPTSAGGQSDHRGSRAARPDLRSHAHSNRPSAAVVREALGAQAEALFYKAFGAPLRRSGAAWRAKDNTAVAMQIHGSKRGLWSDHAAGVGGDLFDLIAIQFLGLDSARQDFPRVMATAAQFCGLKMADVRPDTQAMQQLDARRRQRERDAQAADDQERQRRAALVRDVQALAVDLNSSDDPAHVGSSSGPACAAAKYVQSRGIHTLPATGLSWMPGQGRQSAPPGLIGAAFESLVVWAYNENGDVTGGQRILVQSDGTSVDLEIRKPSFGQIRGSVARFPAVSKAPSPPPLVIAEGPESALSIWQATGYETWAVFGVSGWMSAPVPTDREVILAPDRDAPTSPAGRAFRKALAHHVSRGCQIKVALAPEAVGSKRDLNDTDRRAGPDAVRQAIAQAREIRPWLSLDLNDGQRAAAEAMLNAERLTMVTGHAGTGKTFTLAEVARVWRERGVEVLAGAPSGKATQALATLDGVQVATLSAWESRWARGDGPRSRSTGAGFVFIMDEAGMVGSGQWARLQSYIGAMGGKLIAVGDPEQLQPINEVSGWREAERSVRQAGGQVPVMNIVQRQEDARDRAATMALARGDPASLQAAIQHYVDQGAVSFGLPNPIAAIARDVVKGVNRQDGLPDFESRLAMGATTADVDRLNQAIQAEAIAQGVVDATTLQTLSVERLERSVDSDGRTVTTRTEQHVRVGVGDRVMLTRPFAAAHLPRSSFGTVTAITPEVMTLKMDGTGAPVEINPVAFPHFTYGYAATVHKAQGMTVDQAFVLLHRSMDRYGLNVALTRHRQTVQIYGQDDHCESLEDLTQLALRRDAMSKEYRQVGDHSMVAWPDANTVLSRSDWIGRPHHLPSVKITRDRYLMSVVTRVAGLLGADHADHDPLWTERDGGPTADDTQDPRQVIHDLVARQGVFRAEEVAGVLARQVRDPETFVRLFVEAMSHPDLVCLPRASGRPGETDARVYTTHTHLSAEIRAVDRGLALACRSQQPASTGEGMDVNDVTAPLDDDQQRVFRTSCAPSTASEPAAPGDLQIIEGDTGTGKTRLAAQLAGAMERHGRHVVVVSPTEAGRQALRAEGAEAITLAAYLSQPVGQDVSRAAPKTIILDDAHGLGVEMADIVLARSEAEGSRLIAMVHPRRRPAKAGPVFQRIGERLRHDPRRTPVSLHGQHGVHNTDLQHLGACLQADRSAQEVVTGLRDAVKSGVIVAGGAREDVALRVAESYLADESEDKLALAWSRADADILTVAIRTGLDLSDPERRSFASPEHGACKGLKPRDRLRFASAGNVMNADPSSPGVVRIHRGDMATVVGEDQGLIRLTITGSQGDHPRDILISDDAPLPAWTFAFASTIMASTGRRHQSVHLWAPQTMDRDVFATGVGIARQDLKVCVAATDDQLDDVLDAISQRERLPRSALDYGFHPSRTWARAKGRATRVRMDTGDPALRGASSDDSAAESQAIDAASVTSLPKVSLDHVTLNRAHRAFLDDHPEHILVLLATRQGVFTEQDVRQAFRDNMPSHLSDRDVKLRARQVLTSPEIVTLSRRTPDGALQYMTMARAAQLQQVGVDAARLSAARFAGGDSAVLRPEPLDALNMVQRAAADAMLDARRLTLVTGKAGTGKTFTLKAVATEWRARGVRVLAGAPSGKATAELQGIRGVQAHTLAMWEARWARGEVPTEPFVFIMDEAGMVGAGTWSRIQSRVWALGGKLIAVGDPDQLQPVSDVPGWALAERASGGPVVIDNVMRQHNIFDRLAVEQLARGGDQVLPALAYYEAEGCLKLTSEVLADPIGALARDYVAAGNAPLSTNDEDRPRETRRIALGYSNRDVAALNDHIRQMMTAEAALSQDTGDASTTVHRFDPATERLYGQIIRTFSTQDGMGQRTATDRWLAVGDRVMATAALNAFDIPTSSFGTVVATHDDLLEVLFDGQNTITPLGEREWACLDYGYAATIHKAQGLSADDVFVLAHRRMHRHALYVAMSRHRDRLSVYGRVGHATCVADLVRLGQAPGHLDQGLLELDHQVDQAAPGSVVASITTDDVGQRADWTTLMGSQEPSLRRSAFVGDPHVMAVAERLAGLMAARFDPEAPLVPDGVSDQERRYLQEPTRVIDDLMQRSSVFRVEEVAERCARVVTEPATFLRMLTQALQHEDVIRLSERDAHGVPVYSTTTQLHHDLRAVDLGATLAVSAVSESAPSVDLDALKRRDWRLKLRVDHQSPEAHRHALAWGLTPTRLRLIRGDAGAGKTQIARDLAQTHAQAGWQVVTLAPTGRGLSALETAGVQRPMTVRRFLTETDSSATSGLTARTVVIVDDATRLAGADATALLERVDQSGAKLVALLGGEEQQPMGGHPIMRALDMRVGSLWIGEDQTRDPQRAAMLRSLLHGGERAEAVIAAWRQDDVLVAGATARQAITVMAQQYVADGAQDKIALTWSRADAEAVTQAIRTALDARMPERRGRQLQRHAAVRDLKVGDRLRFVAGTAWVPCEAQTPAWRATRIQVGEQAEVMGFDAKTDALRLQVTARDGQTIREVVIPSGQHDHVPSWVFAFAGTIHGEGAQVRESVHLLAHPGMTRQVLGAGVAAHRAHLSVVVPSAERRMEEVLHRIHRRNGRAESVLDYGFDVTQGARAAWHAAQRAPGRDDRDDMRAVESPSGWTAAWGRLGAWIGLSRAEANPARPSDVMSQVLAEVMGAVAAWEADTHRPVAAADRIALETAIRQCGQPRTWRAVIRHWSSRQRQAADDQAREVVGRGETSAHGLAVARGLARGAGLARMWGEDTVAEIFERALTRWGDHVQRARISGRLDHDVGDAPQEQDRSSSLSDARQASRDAPMIPPPARGDASHAHDLQALQLAVAITERVDAQHPVHQRDLIGEITTLVRQAETLPVDQMMVAQTIAQELARERALSDATCALAKDVVARDPGGPRAQWLSEDVFRAFYRDSRSRLGHPLEFNHREVQEEYDRRVGTVIDTVKASSPHPTALEQTAALVIHHVEQAHRDHALGEALRAIFKEGSLPSADALMQERQQLLTELAALTEVMDQSAARAVLSRLFRSFTHREIQAFADPTSDGAHHGAMVKGLTCLTRSPNYSYCAWHKAVPSLAMTLHPHRALSRSRGLGL